ncbi:MAG: hypothetical protein M9962_08430 [Oligoflexia bacterium]|nr:hypothetical protein [Oligoflexia bacterium]
MKQYAIYFKRSFKDFFLHLPMAFCFSFCLILSFVDFTKEIDGPHSATKIAFVKLFIYCFLFLFLFTIQTIFLKKYKHFLIRLGFTFFIIPIFTLHVFVLQKLTGASSWEEQNYIVNMCSAVIPKSCIKAVKRNRASYEKLSEEWKYLVQNGLNSESKERYRKARSIASIEQNRMLRQEVLYLEKKGFQLLNKIDHDQEAREELRNLVRSVFMKDPNNEAALYWLRRLNES